jgi:hypothetical protein
MPRTIAARTGNMADIKPLNLAHASLYGRAYLAVALCLPGGHGH